MKKMLALAAVVLLAVAPSDQRAIESQIDRWLDAFNAGDITPINDIFSSDFVYMTTGVKGTLTKAQVAAGMQAQFLKYRTNIVGITDEIRISGDMAYDRGRFTITLVPKAGGASIVSTGQFLETWHKESDGQWRVTRLANFDDSVK